MSLEINFFVYDALKKEEENNRERERERERERKKKKEIGTKEGQMKSDRRPSSLQIRWSRGCCEREPS